MHIKDCSKVNKKCLILTAFLFCLSLPLSINVHLSLGNPDYTYYGVVPAKIYSYNLTNTNDRNSAWRLDTGSVGNASLLVIVAAVDGTHVKVYDLTIDKIVSEVDIDSMGKHYVLLANGTKFKVESNNRVFVIPTNEELAIASDTYEFAKKSLKH